MFLTSSKQLSLVVRGHRRRRTVALALRGVVSVATGGTSGAVAERHHGVRMATAFYKSRFLPSIAMMEL